MSAEPAGTANEFQLLEALSAAPETTQADLAAQVGVAVGTVNWYLKRWSKKGYVKVRRMGRWNWSYLLTPEGMAHKAKLAGEYLEVSLRVYRETRQEAKRLLGEVKAAGYDAVCVEGDGEIAEICRLTCLEMQVAVQAQEDSQAPVLRVGGLQVTLVLPGEVIERRFVGAFRKWRSLKRAVNRSR